MTQEEKVNLRDIALRWAKIAYPLMTHEDQMEAEAFFPELKKSDTDFSDLRTWKYIVDAVLTEKDGIGQYLDDPFTEEVAKKLQKRFGNVEQKQQSKSVLKGNYEETIPTWDEHDELNRRIKDAFRHSLEEFFSDRAELISARKKPGWRLSPPM